MQTKARDWNNDLLSTEDFQLILIKRIKQYLHNEVSLNSVFFLVRHIRSKRGIKFNAQIVGALAMLDFLSEYIEENRKTDTKFITETLKEILRDLSSG